MNQKTVSPVRKTHHGCSVNFLVMFLSPLTSVCGLSFLLFACYYVVGARHWSWSPIYSLIHHLSTCLPQGLRTCCFPACGALFTDSRHQSLNFTHQRCLYGDYLNTATSPRICHSLSHYVALFFFTTLHSTWPFLCSSLFIVFFF